MDKRTGGRRKRMKLQFKHQKFQADAAKAVVDVFAGQPYLTPTYMIDRGVARDRYGLSGYTTEFGMKKTLQDGQMLELFQSSLKNRFLNIFRKFSEIIRLSRQKVLRESITLR